MATITLKGTEFNTNGTLPKVGAKAPNFLLTASDLSHKSLADFAGKKIILNIFPSIDTSTCATSVRTFNKNAVELDNTVVVCISRDLPFSQSRFCSAEGIENVVLLSDFGTGDFGKDYGLEIINGPLKHLHSRAIVMIDEKGFINYTEQVSEIVDEPNYVAALKEI
jgi:thioredoxin-dependent peroxiredoxin